MKTKTAKKKGQKLLVLDAYRIGHSLLKNTGDKKKHGSGAKVKDREITDRTKNQHKSDMENPMEHKTPPLASNNNS